MKGANEVKSRPDNLQSEKCHGVKVAESCKLIMTINTERNEYTSYECRGNNKTDFEMSEITC